MINNSVVEQFGKVKFLYEFIEFLNVNKVHEPTRISTHLCVKD